MFCPGFGCTEAVRPSPSIRLNRNRNTGTCESTCERAPSVLGGGIRPGGERTEGAKTERLERDPRELVDADLGQIDAERRELVVHAREHVAVDTAFVLEQRA